VISHFCVFDRVRIFHISNFRRCRQDQLHNRLDKNCPVKNGLVHQWICMELLAD